MNAASPAFEPQAKPAERGVAAGLVPYKTNGSSFFEPLFSDSKIINLASQASALRRVNRLKRSVWASGHLHGLAERGSRPSKCWFVTLTYKPGVEWSPDHLSGAVLGYRNWCKSRKVPCRYTWVAELQSRGAVHYHLLAWLPVGVRMPMWDRRTVTSRGAERLAFWPHGMTNRQIALSGVGYLMKYLSKLGELTKFPKGLRLYGIGGLDSVGRDVRRWYNLPTWCKHEYGVGELVRKVGAIVVKATGEILAPAFRACVAPGGGFLIITQLRALVEPGDRFRCGAYSKVDFV